MKYMREYDLRKVLHDVLKEIDETEEVREYAEEIKWLCEYIDGLKKNYVVKIRK